MMVGIEIIIEVIIQNNSRIMNNNMREIFKKGLKFLEVFKDLKSLIFQIKV